MLDKKDIEWLISTALTIFLFWLNRREMKKQQKQPQKKKPHKRRRSRKQRR